MTSVCAALRMQIAAYADDELGVEAAILIERHLGACAACRRAVARQRHLVHALRELHPIDAPPPGFEARLRHAVVGPTIAPRRALAAGVAVLAVAGAVVLGMARSDDGGARDAAVADGRERGHGLDDGAPLDRTRGVAPLDHTRGVAPLDRTRDAAPTDESAALAAAVALHRRGDDHMALAATSGDVADVNAWLRTRLPFAPDIRPPGSPAVAIRGATVVALGDRPAGLVRYRLDGRAVSLFLTAAPAWSAGTSAVRVGAMEFHVFRRAGVDVVGWSHASLSYLLVSDDGLATGAACAACHGDDGRRSIAEFVRAVRGDAVDA